MDIQLYDSDVNTYEIVYEKKELIKISTKYCIIFLIMITISLFTSRLIDKNVTTYTYCNVRKTKEYH